MMSAQTGLWLEHVRKPRILLQSQNCGYAAPRLVLAVSQDTPRTPPGRLARNSAISLRKRVSGHALEPLTSQRTLAFLIVQFCAATQSNFFLMPSIFHEYGSAFADGPKHIERCDEKFYR